MSRRTNSGRKVRAISIARLAMKGDLDFVSQQLERRAMPPAVSTLSSTTRMRELFLIVSGPVSADASRALSAFGPAAKR